MVDKLLHGTGKGEKMTREEFAQMITELVKKTGKSRSYQGIGSSS